MRELIEESAIIAKYGMMIQCVTGEAVLSYTIGLSKICGVELFIVGVPIEYAGAMLNSIRSQYLKGSVKLVHDEILDKVADGFLVQLKMLDDDKANVFYTAESVLGTKPKFLRVTYPDKDGIFPWQKGCDALIAELQSDEFLESYE